MTYTVVYSTLHYTTLPAAPVNLSLWDSGLLLTWALDAPVQCSAVQCSVGLSMAVQCWAVQIRAQKFIMNFTDIWGWRLSVSSWDFHSSMNVGLVPTFSSLKGSYHEMSRHASGRLSDSRFSQGGRGGKVKKDAQGCSEEAAAISGLSLTGRARDGRKTQYFR